MAQGNSKKQIFVLYTCDAWKGTNSMRLLMATTSVTKLKVFIARKIKDGTFDYGFDETLSRAKQEAEFRKDFQDLRSTEINGKLKYGMYDYVYDGEEV